MILLSAICMAGWDSPDATQASLSRLKDLAVTDRGISRQWVLRARVSRPRLDEGSRLIRVVLKDGPDELPGLIGTAGGLLGEGDQVVVSGQLGVWNGQRVFHIFRIHSLWKAAPAGKGRAPASSGALIP